MESNPGPTFKELEDTVVGAFDPDDKETVLDVFKSISENLKEKRRSSLDELRKWFLDEQFDLCRSSISKDSFKGKILECIKEELISKLLLI